jgi:y4mF family transcriptional regulator
MPQAVKIGYSNNCKARVRDINRGNELPYPFKLVKKWEVSNAYKLEQEVHRHLDFCRILNTECFTLLPQKAVEVIDKIVNDGVYEFFEKDPSKTMVKVTDVQSLGRLIRRERKRQKLTQKQLAFASGVGLRFIIEVERGKATAQIGKVFVILSLLRLSCLFEVKS